MSAASSTRRTLHWVLRVLGWTAALLVAAAFALCHFVVFVNRHDAEPSAAAIRLSAAYENRPAVRDEDNGFVYVMGFDVAPDDDPVAMGLKRIEWVRQYDATATELAPDPAGERSDYAAKRHPVLKEYATACSPLGSGCREAYKSARAKFADLESSEVWLLDRYRSLIGYGAWREFIPNDFAAPLPRYQVVMDGQKLWLLKAAVAASEHDAIALNRMLATDLRFWRTVLASADTLITKMIATAAITRHFKLGASALRELPPRLVAAATPTDWDVGLTSQELSLSRVLAGEYVVTANMLRNTRAREVAVDMVEDEGLAPLWVARFSAHFYQPQDTINQGAEHIARTAEILESVPLADYEATTNRITELSEAAPRATYWPPYNLFGRLVLRWGWGDYGNYARRVGDVEGVRRAALAAIRLHEDQVKADEIPKALAGSEFRSPYDGQPFEWDTTSETVVFRGLQPGERGVYRIG
jgi:hypothetical protein